MTTDRMLEIGRQFGFPAVRLTRATVLNAGEFNWRRFFARMSEEERFQLKTALVLGEALGREDDDDGT